MTRDANRQIVLASRPVSYPRESDFKVVETPVPKPREGELLVKAIWLSLDPYQRGRMRAARSYAAPVEVGEVITGGVVGRVVESRTTAFEVGDVHVDVTPRDARAVRRCELGGGGKATKRGHCREGDQGRDRFSHASLHRLTVASLRGSRHGALLRESDPGVGPETGLAGGV